MNYHLLKLFFLSFFVLTQAQTHAFANEACLKTFTENVSLEIPYVSESILQSRYGVAEKDVVRTPRFKIPVIVKMEKHETLAPVLKLAGGAPIKEKKTYDTVIVGGGPAGLTAALYLAEAGKSVLILERNPQVGGLAMGNELNGVRAAGGAAYSAGPEGKFEYSVFQKIGLGNYKKKLTIKEPIDSYLWKGKLYKGIWEEHTLKELPASFSLFKHALLKLHKLGAGKDEGKYAEWADEMDMATLVRRMPELVKDWKDPASRKIYNQFLKDKNVAAVDPMKDVIELLDLYGPSALGGVAEKISARQFIDFYASEIFTRYTGTLGTGTIVEALKKKLDKYQHLVDIRTSSPVSELSDVGDGSRVVFTEGGVAKEAWGKKTIFAAAMALAPKLIKDLEKNDPEKVTTISSVEMTDYAVHVARLKGHPYRATYDTWVHGNGDRSKPTDFINGRWQDPSIDAYEGIRNFEKNPQDDYGIISVYQPLGKSNWENFSPSTYLKKIEDSVEFMLQKLKGLAKENGQKIEVELVESYRWPESIHIVSPGYLKKIPVLARRVGNIHFANNTIAAPELETAMARAAREAMTVIEILNGKKKDN